MNGIINFAQLFINRAAEGYKKNNPGRKATRWKYCVALEKAGYKAGCEVVENSSDLVFNWNKEGEDEIKVRLSLAEQQMWLNYLERRAAKESKDDNDTE